MQKSEDSHPRFFKILLIFIKYHFLLRKNLHQYLIFWAAVYYQKVWCLNGYNINHCLHSGGRHYVDFARCSDDLGRRHIYGRHHIYGLDFGNNYHRSNGGNGYYKHIHYGDNVSNLCRPQ